MKTIKVLLMAVPMALSLFSCVQDEGIQSEKTSKHEVHLTMGFTLAADLSTRATRPLTSIDPWQRVTDMRVYVFRLDSEDGTYKLYSPEVKDNNGKIRKQPNIYISDFNKTHSDDNDGIWKDPLEDESHTYTITPMLPDGYYRLLAVGYDDPNMSPVKLNWTEGKTTWETATLVNNSGSPVASEIFTGYPRDIYGNVQTLHVNPNSDDIYVEIKCRRTVAGVLLYLKNIPANYIAEDSWSGIGGGTGIITSDLIKGKDYKIHEVALVTIGHNPIVNAVSRHWENDFVFDNSRFKLTRLASIEINPEEGEGDGEIKYIRKTFPAVGNFVMPSDTYIAKDNPLVADYIGGLLDKDSRKFDKSLYLCFFTKTGSGLYYPVKLWPVKLVRSNIQDVESEDLCAGELMLQPDNPFNYNLVANHLYCLGMYKADGSIDQPVDLEKERNEHNETVNIVVIGSWQYEINIEM